MTRSFNGRVDKFCVYAATQDVYVLVTPTYSQDDSLKVLANTERCFEDMDATSVSIVRPVATAIELNW